MTAREGSLFTGTAALGMAATEVLGSEPVWFSDLDAGASKLLAHHYPHVPNLGDITAVDWDQVEPIEVLTAGWPCQPWSTAGKRKGTGDERALWPEVDRAIRHLRPRYVLLENVSAIVAAGELARAADSLAACGYRFGWVVLGAGDIGAPHRRNRCFIAAVADTEDLGHQRPGNTRHRWSGDPDHRVPLANSAGDRWNEGRPEPAGLVGGPDAAERSASPADADRHEFARERPEERRDTAASWGGESLGWGPYEPAIRRWEAILGRAAPAPTVVGARGGRVLSPALTEWMMGLPEGWITSVPGLSRNDQLKLAGNGVVVQQAVAAFRHLMPLLAHHPAA